MNLTSLVPMVQVRSVRRPIEFYAYSEDVVAFRSLLVQAGVDAGPIEHPFYSPRGELCVTDLDGYVMMVSHT